MGWHRCGGMFTDDELAAQAMAADPDAAPADDAVSFWEVAAEPGAPPLVADWYMPAPMAGAGTGTRSPWRRRVALVLVATFLLIEAYGLCSTYGGR